MASRLRLEFRGAQRVLFTAHQPEFVLVGPAGTGKTLACLHKLHLCALKYRGMRALMLRKTRESMTQTVLVTFTRQVRPELNGAYFHRQDQEFRYPNGSVVVVGGLDKPTKVMSGEYDLIYAAEATDLYEADYEALTTRLRHGSMPYQQLIADCNPGPPTHWLKQRANRAAAAGAPILFATRHEDNPTLYADGAWTEAGRAYLARLDSLTGVRKLRYRDGLWAAAEGLIYEDWDERLHVVPMRPIPPSWPRYWAVDFGYTNPFVWQLWAEDPDGRLYRIRELYQTGWLVEDLARRILELTVGEPAPRAIICDHDAEDRATLERYLKQRTIPAVKLVSPGLQAVASRLRRAGDGQPRLYLLDGALVSRDPAREAARRTCSTDEEFEGYVWDTSGGRRRGEQPLKQDDHGMDALRYVVTHVDGIGKERRPYHAAAAGATPRFVPR